MMYLTGDQAAAMLNVSRRTLYRWHHAGLLHVWEWTEEIITVKALRPRQRGPRRNPESKRYHEGRHSFAKERTQ